MLLLYVLWLPHKKTSCVSSLAELHPICNAGEEELAEHAVSAVEHLKQQIPY